LSKNKRSASGTGSIRKRPDGRWEGRYTVGIDPKTGKQIRRSVYGKTQREVRNKMLVFLSEISQDTYIEPSKIKLQDWLQTWIDEFSFDKRYSTLKGYKAQIKKHIVPALGKYYLEDLTPLLIQRFYNDLIRPDEDGKCLSPKSIKNVHIVLRAALQQAVELEFIKKNPCHKAKLPKVYKTEITPLTDQQVHDFLQEAQNDEYYGTILRVILFTGLREGEALGLTWDCVNFKYGTIVINKQLQRRPQKDGGTVLSSVKNGKTRQLKPAPYVMQLLKSRYSQQIMQSRVAGSAWEAWQNEGEHKKALVFTNEVGHHLIPKRTYLRFKKIAEEIGVPDARVHDLRHTFAVLSLQNGDDVKTVQTNLGHASAAFTLDVYGHVNDRMQRESSDRMEQYIKSLAANG
jgi:integrase